MKISKTLKNISSLSPIRKLPDEPTTKPNLPPSLYKTPLTYYSINSTHRTSMEEMERDIFGSNSYYTILGVCSDSSPEEIRSAYRRLAMVTFATHFSLNLFWKYQMPIMFDLCSDGIQIGGREEGLPLLC